VLQKWSKCKFNFNIKDSQSLTSPTLVACCLTRQRSGFRQLDMGQSVWQIRNCASTFDPPLSLFLSTLVCITCYSYSPHPVILWYFSSLPSSARLIMRLQKWAIVSKLMYYHLHWMPILQRIIFKLGTVAHNCIHGIAPVYLLGCALLLHQYRRVLYFLLLRPVADLTRTLTRKRCAHYSFTVASLLYNIRFNGINQDIMICKWYNT